MLRRLIIKNEEKDFVIKAVNAILNLYRCTTPSCVELKLHYINRSARNLDIEVEK